MFADDFYNFLSIFLQQNHLLSVCDQHFKVLLVAGGQCEIIYYLPIDFSLRAHLESFVLGFNSGDEIVFGGEIILKGLKLADELDVCLFQFSDLEDFLVNLMLLHKCFDIFPVKKVFRLIISLLEIFYVFFQLMIGAGVFLNHFFEL